MSHCLPHARGGVSAFKMRMVEHSRSSPRTWGCFQIRTDLVMRIGVFPTHVGVFPRRLLHQIEQGSLPHARGGVSP